jgi:hypothetical protein
MAAINFDKFNLSPPHKASLPAIPATPFLSAWATADQTPPGIIRHITIRDVTVDVPADKPDRGYETEGPALRHPHNIFPSSITGLPGHPVEDVTLEHIRIIYHGKDDPAFARYQGDRLDQVPENEKDYPEFSMFGELPAWGFYIRHANDIHFSHVTLRQEGAREGASFRPAVIFDDVQGFTIRHSGRAPVIVGPNKGHRVPAR